jgi:uncharacterized membrane protein AbrB (regulator of aidB expression)
MTPIRKAILLTATFLISSAVGTFSLLMVVMLCGIFYIRLSSMHSAHSGTGAVCGGVSEVFVFSVPILFGIIGILLTLRWIDNRKSQH